MADDQTDTVHYDPNWIAGAGGWLHTNNILWYFAQSPFFDPQSANAELLSQYSNTPNENKLLGVSASWHHELRKRRGISYVVHYDPLEAAARFNGPHGEEQSNIWVIRKQQRDEPEDDANIKVLGFYFIVNDAIYEAPSLASILTTRMLNTTTAMNKLFDNAGQLPIFSAAHGHTYIKPKHKAASQPRADAAHQNKEGTPLPTQDSSVAEKDIKSANHAVAGQDHDAWILDFALKRTIQHRSEFSDEKPLVGEPGKLRFSTQKEQPGAFHPNKGAPSQLSSSRVATPMYSRAASTVPR